MIIKIHTKLKMWEKTDMPDSNYDEVSKKWIKTGTKSEKTTYTFIDIAGDKLVFMADNKFRELEGKEVYLEVNIGYDAFNNKNVVKFANLIPAPVK